MVGQAVVIQSVLPDTGDRRVVVGGDLVVHAVQLVDAGLGTPNDADLVSRARAALFDVVATAHLPANDAQQRYAVRLLETHRPGGAGYPPSADAASLRAR